VTTLIAVYGSDGPVGRCDARCYDARPGTGCDCICGGANHAAGLRQAEDNTRAQAGRWAERARAAGQDVSRTVLADSTACEPLFSLAPISRKAAPHAVRR
jgi:hypothetical protein